MELHGAESSAGTGIGIEELIEVEVDMKYAIRFPSSDRGWRRVAAKRGKTSPTT